MMPPASGLASNLCQERADRLGRGRGALQRSSPTPTWLRLFVRFTAPNGATDSILGPEDEDDDLSLVIERLDCHGLGGIGIGWLGRQGGGSNEIFAGYRRTRDRGLPVLVIIDPLELSEVATDGSQVVEDRMLTIVHARSRVRVTKADR